MIPLGYMYKPVRKKSALLNAESVVDIYSVSGCTAPEFADFIHFWKHNGYWLFNSPEDMQTLALEHDISLSGMTLFYYEGDGKEFDLVTDPNGGDDDIPQWSPVKPESSFVTNIIPPKERSLAGFDIVEYSCGNSAEDCLMQCCDAIAAACKPNVHCLLDSYEEAKMHLESGIFHEHEPGPYRIVAVYVIPQ